MKTDCWINLQEPAVISSNRGWWRSIDSERFNEESTVEIGDRERIDSREWRQDQSSSCAGSRFRELAQEECQAFISNRGEIKLISSTLQVSIISSSRDFTNCSFSFSNSVIISSRYLSIVSALSRPSASFISFVITLVLRLARARASFLVISWSTSLPHVGHHFIKSYRKLNNKIHSFNRSRRFTSNLDILLHHRNSTPSERTRCETHMIQKPTWYKNQMSIILTPVMSCRVMSCHVMSCHAHNEDKLLNQLTGAWWCLTGDGWSVSSAAGCKRKSVNVLLALCIKHYTSCMCLWNNYKDVLYMYLWQ